MFKHTPIRVRDKPFAGTKTMRCPKDEHLRELVTGRSIEVVLPSTPAKVLGFLAVSIAAGMIALYWADRLLHAPEESWIGPGSIFLGLASFHLLVIFSQILSSGRNLMGPLAILVLYAGIIASVVIEWILA